MHHMDAKNIPKVIQTAQLANRIKYFTAIHIFVRQTYHTKPTVDVPN